MRAVKVRILSEEGAPFRLHVETAADRFEFGLEHLSSDALHLLAVHAGWAQQAAAEMEDARATRTAAVDGLDAYPVGDVKRVEMERAAHGQRGI